MVPIWHKMEVTDDSGFLALVSPATYSTFVHANWNLDQLFNHFREQMNRRSLLIWGTGLEGFWKVHVFVGSEGASGFREVVGTIDIVGGQLLVTNYESLTMAAQFPDERLPQRHEQDQLIPLSDGSYSCRVVQMFDPEDADRAKRGPDFVITLARLDAPGAPWTEIPWFSLDDD